MSNVILETPALETISLARFKRQLGTPADRKVFTKAINELREINQLAKDAQFPKRFPELEKRLKELGLYPHAELAEQVFEKQIEAARAHLAEFLGRQVKPRFLAAVLPAVAVLDRRLIELLKTEAARVEKIETELYAPWEPSFQVPPLTRAIRGMIAANAKDSEERGAERFFNFCGEDPVAILESWFTEPLTLAT